MGKPPKLDLRDIGDVPLREVSGVVLRGAELLVVGDRDPVGGTVEAEAMWRIEGSPENAEGLVIMDDGTALVGLDTKLPRRNLLRLGQLPLD